MKSFDFLSFQPSLYVSGKKKYLSIFGAIISVLAILLSIGSAVYLAYQFFGRSNFKLDSSVKIQSKDQKFSFSNESISTFIGFVSKTYQYFVDPTIYTLDAIRIDKDGDSQSVITPVEVDRCERYYSQQDIVEKSHKLDLKNFYCIKPNSSEIRGYWGAKSPFTSTRVYIRRCKNSTENRNHCKSKEEIDETVQSGYVSIYTSSYFFDPGNYKNPFKKFFIDIFYMVNANSSWEMNIFYRQNFLFTDDSFLFYNSKQVSLPVLKNENIFIFYKIQKSDVIASLNFQLHYIQEEYHRTYMKIQDLLTQAGGLIKAIYLISVILVKFPSEVLFYVSKVVDMSNSEKKDKIENKPLNIINDILQFSKQQNNTNLQIVKTVPIPERPVPRVSKKKFILGCLCDITCCRKSSGRKFYSKYMNVKSFYQNLLSVDQIAEKLLFVDLLVSQNISLKSVNENSSKLLSLCLTKYDLNNKNKFLNIPKTEIAKFNKPAN